MEFRLDGTRVFVPLADVRQLERELADALTALEELLRYCDASSDGETPWERAVLKARRVLGRK